MANVSDVKSKQILYGTDVDGISAAASATTLVLLNSGPWVNAQTVTITSPSGNNAGITFTVVGKDADGAAQTSAATTGPAGGATVDISGTWTEVTSIKSSGAITTSISAGVKDGTATGIVFAGRTRVRGMNGVAGAGAGRLYFKNSSATTGANKLILDVDNGEAIAPYIPDNGILFADGAYFAYDGTAVVGVSVQYDG
jgi:hypothetical protein